jgi:hypothetical protein
MTDLHKAIAASVALSLGLCACTASDRARYEMKSESETQCGVMRTVTAYSQTGQKLGEWHGKIDVQYEYDSSYQSGTAGDRVDVVVFDGDSPVDRVVISGAIVIVDND